MSLGLQPRREGGRLGEDRPPDRVWESQRRKEWEQGKSRRLSSFYCILTVKNVLFPCSQEAAFLSFNYYLEQSHFVLNNFSFKRKKWRRGRTHFSK